MKVLSVDIGGSFIKYALMDENSTFLNKGTIPTPKAGRTALIDTLSGLFLRNPDAEGISISMPGIIDSEKGYCLMGGALEYNNDFYLRDALFEKIHTKILMNNDAKCAAMAEASVGSLKDAESGMVILLGTMIGGGIVLNHRLLMGKHFSAGEVSYILPYADRRVQKEDVWGNSCGTPSLCRLYAQNKGLEAEKVDGKLVFSAFDRGDEAAASALAAYTRRIAVQLFNFQTLLDLEKIAIGGGISEHPALLEYIKKALNRLYIECPYTLPHAEIVRCKFGNDANLIGALQYFLKSSE